MGLQFTSTEKHVLHNSGGYSRQLLYYWEQQGYVPSRHLLKVSKLIGRKVEDLLGGDTDNDRNASNA